MTENQTRNLTILFSQYAYEECTIYKIDLSTCIGLESDLPSEPSLYRYCLLLTSKYELLEPVPSITDLNELEETLNNQERNKHFYLTTCNCGYPPDNGKVEGFQIFFENKNVYVTCLDDEPSREFIFPADNWAKQVQFALTFHANLRSFLNISLMDVEQQLKKLSTIYSSPSLRQLGYYDGLPQSYLDAMGYKLFAKKALMTVTVALPVDIELNQYLLGIRMYQGKSPKLSGNPFIYQASLRLVGN